MVAKQTVKKKAGTKRKSGPHAGKKPGGQPGNKNAMRHGFYAKRFTADENKRLDGIEPTDLLSEIALLRVCMDKLTNELSFDIVYFQDKDGTETNSRDDHYLKQLNTLSLMTQSLSTLTRTHHLIHGKSGNVIDAIQQALEELRLEMGL